MQDLERLTLRPVGGRTLRKRVVKVDMALGGPDTVMSSTIAVQETLTSLADLTRAGWSPRQKRRQPRVQPCLGPVWERTLARTSPLECTRRVDG